jgi:hypothetical protein
MVRAMYEAITTGNNQVYQIQTQRRNRAIANALNCDPTMHAPEWLTCTHELYDLARRTMEWKRS